MMIMMMTMMISDVGKGLDVRPSSSTSRGQRGRSLRCLRTWKTWASRWPQSVTWSRLTLTGWPFHLQACSQFQDWNLVLIDLFQDPEAKLSSLRRQRLGGWLTESIPPSSTGSSFILIPHFIQFLIFAAISIVSGEHSRLWLWPVQHAPAGLCQWGRHRQGLASAGRRAPRAGLLTFMSTTSILTIMSEAKNCENVRSFFSQLSSHHDNWLIRWTSRQVLLPRTVTRSPLWSSTPLLRWEKREKWLIRLIRTSLPLPPMTSQSRSGTWVRPKLRHTAWTVTRTK